MKKLMEQELQEIYERVVPGRASRRRRKPVTDEVVERAHREMFAARPLYRRGGIYDPAARLEMLDDHRDLKPVTTEQLLDADWKMFV